MSARKWGLANVVAMTTLAVVSAGWPSGHAVAQNIRFGNQVGGVVVDTDGILKAANVDELNQLAKARAEQLKRLPDDLQEPSPLRKLSLRRLQEEFIARKEKAQTPLFTEEMECLAGLTRIRYVFVYPDEKDIVLVGPAEPMKVSANGHMVGKQS